MSNLKTKRVQIGDHSTATNNFVMHQSDTPDGKVHISNGTLDDHTSRMTLAHDGKLGVGTDSPGEKLDVNGDMRVRGSGSTIGGANVANAAILVGDTSTGLGIDTNEIYSKGDNLYLGVLDASSNIVFRLNNNVLMNITTDGYVTKTSTPRFHVYDSPSFNGSDVAVNFGNTLMNVGSHFSNSNGRFTAPIAGSYMFTAGIWSQNGATGGSRFIALTKNGTDQMAGSNNANITQEQLTIACVFDLAVNDYIELRRSGLNVQNSTPRNYFSGYLLG
jgi:hypothetical protein